MNTQKARFALKKVAEREGVSMEQVTEDIEAAILEAIRHSYSQNDMAAIAAWQRIPCKGERPTALELVAYLAEQVNKDI